MERAQYTVFVKCMIDFTWFPFDEQECKMETIIGKR